MRERLIWISAGLMGLLLAAALASATNRVTQPDVGLAGEPVSAGEALAPPPQTTVTVTTPAPAAKARPAKRAKKKQAEAARKAVTPALATLPARVIPRTTAPSASRPASSGAGRKRTTTTTTKRRPAPVAKVTIPKVVSPVLAPPTVTVDEAADASGKGSDNSGKGKDGGGDGDSADD